MYSICKVCDTDIQKYIDLVLVNVSLSQVTNL